MTRKVESTDDLKRMLFDLGVQVRQADLGGEARALTRKMNDGYLVVIDNALSFDAMLDAALHEIKHILLGHLDDAEKTETEKESEVKEKSSVIIIDRGECHKKIYSVS